MQNDRSLRPIPQPIAVARDEPESIGAWPEVRVDRLPRRNRRTPGLIEILEKISKANPFRIRETQPRVIQSDSPGSGRNSNRAGEPHAVVIGGDGLDVWQRGHGTVSDQRWIDNRQAAAQRKPDPARGI